MRNSSSATIKQVAERAGVSTMTVSLSLRDSGSRISEETRLRVLEAARALHYRPNARARALRSGATNILGLYAGYGFVNVRRPFFTEIISGLQEGCERFQKDLLLHGVFHGETPESILMELVDGRIDGLIVNIAADGVLARKLAESRLPVVAVADPVPGIPSVLVDDREGARLMAAYLRERDFARFVYVDGSLPAISAVRRREAFLDAAQEFGLEKVGALSSESDWESALLPPLLGHVRARSGLAIVCWNDDTAYGLLGALRRQGVRVPEDVGIVGFDGCPTPFDEFWSLTTIRAPWAAVARAAVEQMDRLLTGGVAEPEITLPVELLKGQTA